LRLYTDYGRCCRPLFIVKDQKLIIKKSDILRLQNTEEVKYGWQELVYSGYIE
jgi:DNA-directed RNA polymerase II subunit RPB2